jgi:hypothetical protein
MLLMPKSNAELRGIELIREIDYERVGHFEFETRDDRKMSLQIMEPASVEDYKKYPLIISTNEFDSKNEAIPESLEMMVTEGQSALITALAYFARNRMYERRKAQAGIGKAIEELLDALGKEDEKPPTPADPKWRLQCLENGLVKVLGDMVEDPSGDRYELTGIFPPHKPSSTGKVQVTDEDGNHNIWYPSVIGLKFKEVRS